MDPHEISCILTQKQESHFKSPINTNTKFCIVQYKNPFSQKNTKETRVARQPPSTSFSIQGNRKTTALLPPKGSCLKQWKKTDSEELRQSSETAILQKLYLIMFYWV